MFPKHIFFRLIFDFLKIHAISDFLYFVVFVIFPVIHLLFGSYVPNTVRNETLVLTNRNLHITRNKLILLKMQNMPSKC